MIEIGEFTKPFPLAVPEEHVAELEALRIRLANAGEDTFQDAEQELMQAITCSPEDIFKLDCTKSKDRVCSATSKNITIKPNCTDRTAAMLTTATHLGQTCFAKFDSKHANVVIPQPPDVMWKLDKFIDLLQAEKHTLGVGDYTESYDATIRAIDEHPDTNGLLVWSEGEKIGKKLIQQWFWEPFDGVNIREETKTLLKNKETIKIPSLSFVLVRPPLAYSMLQAIDVLKHFKFHLLGQGLVPKNVAAYGEAKEMLIDFVPKLR